MIKRFICWLWGHTPFKGPLLVLQNHATLNANEVKLIVPRNCRRCAANIIVAKAKENGDE